MIAEIIVAISSIIGALRVLLFKRCGATKRPIITFLAYVIFICLMAQAIDVVVNKCDVTWWSAGLTVSITLALLYNKGNVSKFLK